MAALLHDVVDDTDATLDAIRDAFGQQVAQCVDAVSRLSEVNQMMRRHLRQQASCWQALPLWFDQLRAVSSTPCTHCWPPSQRASDSLCQRCPGLQAAGQELHSAQRLPAHEGDALRHFMVCLTDEPLVLAVKLADRLHNLRTCHVLAPDKRAAVAIETLEVWCSLAEQLGMFPLKVGPHPRAWLLHPSLAA